MRNFVSALSFLTTIPLGKLSGKPAGASILYFPLIGLLIGGLLAGVDRLGSLFLFEELRILVDVAFLVIITGGLHLDGLADSADGLYFHHDKEKVFKIMKDPRIGVMGVLALMFCLGFKVVGIGALDARSCWVWFVVAPALARSAQVVGLVFITDARETGGVGQTLYQKGKYQYLIFCLIPLALPFLVSVPVGLIVGAAFVIIIACFFVFIRTRLGGMTGDTFGALTETVETWFLVFGGWVCKGLI
ncbi:MAG: adenosylcobinamide-GDP ribazoletransferase [Nitrospinota bacterium]|nr:adenosylcobinamide-GDP ribazoletransferase [Nitrospinota bacterium]